MPRLFWLSLKPSKVQCYKVCCLWKPKPGYGAPTHIHNDVFLCSHVRLIDLRGSERHPTPQMFKQACFTCCQKAGLCRQWVLRGWCSWAAAGLRLHVHQALPAELFSSCVALPQQWLTSGLGYQAVIPSLLAKSSLWVSLRRSRVFAYYSLVVSQFALIPALVSQGQKAGKLCGFFFFGRLFFFLIFC